MISVVFYMSLQLGVIGPKGQDLVISFCLGEGEILLQFYIRAIQIKN